MSERQAPPVGYYEDSDGVLRDPVQERQHPHRGVPDLDEPVRHRARPVQKPRSARWWFRSGETIAIIAFFLLVIASGAAVILLAIFVLGWSVTHTWPVFIIAALLLAAALWSARTKGRRR